jgi:uncharacterized protein YndB with AHSA1/START domain
VRLDVALEETLDHPVEAVWARLTDPAAIAEWLMPVEGFRPEVGCRFRLKTQHLSSDGWVRAEVLELDPPRRMVWSWSPADDAAPTRVGFELQAEPDGATRLRLTHEGEIDAGIGALLRDGWPGRIELLRRLS